MKLSEVFQQLTYGELSQLQIGGAEEQGITKENQNRILVHINLGLTELHKRFPLNKGELKIRQVEGLSRYVLSKQYAVANMESWEPEKYIQDTIGQPFLDTVLKIEQVFDAEGNELGLNGAPGKLAAGKDTYDSWAIPQVFTPAFNVLQVPEGVVEGDLRVVFRANHAQIFREDNSFDPEEIEIDLPYSHLEALLYYVASRIMNPIGLSQQFHEGNNYAAKFEQACAQLQNLGLETREVDSFSRLRSNGWV